MKVKVIKINFRRDWGIKVIFMIFIWSFMIPIVTNNKVKKVILVPSR